MKTVKNLVEDARRRTVLLCLWVLGLAYVMSLTSNSVWVNVPVALLIIAALRSLTGEVQIRWKAGQVPSPAASKVRLPRYRARTAKGPRRHSSASALEAWRASIEAPEVEAALEELSGAIVREWVTSLWFHALSADTEFPAELANLIHNIFAAVARRVRHINLITLMTKDAPDLVAAHLELFRKTQARVGADALAMFSSEEREENIKQAMAAAGELHPALTSPESEGRVLQKLMDGVVGLVLNLDDANCKVLKCLGRELLAAAVIRPVMNLLNPTFINTLIENAAARTSANLPDGSKGPTAAAAPDKRTAERSSDRPPLKGEPSTDLGLQMVAAAPAKVGQEERSVGGLKASPSEGALQKMGREELGSTEIEGLVEGAGPSRKAEGKSKGKESEAGKDKESWAQLLEAVNQRKTMALAPEHLDNLWTKGRNYKKRDVGKPSPKPGDANIPKEAPKSTPLAREQSIPQSKLKSEGKPKRIPGPRKARAQRELSPQSSADEGLVRSALNLTQEEWISAKGTVPESEAPRGMRRSRSIGTELDGWQALAHAGQEGLLKSGDGVGLGPGFDLDLALRKKKNSQQTTLGDAECLALSSMLCNHLQVDVVGAHFEKGGSKTFAVYSIFVTDLQNRTWEVQRRFRNFEQLHRSLKDKPYYNLSLPAKRYLSSNLDSSFIRQRCALLDKYLKDLLAIPSIAEVYEVWDFLSANSQTYGFGDSPSIIKTLTSNVDDAVDDMFRQFRTTTDAKPAPVISVDDIRKQVMVMGSNASPTTSHLPILKDSSSSSTRGSTGEKSDPKSIWNDDVESSQDAGVQALGLGWLPEYEIQQALGSSPPGSERGLLSAQRAYEGRRDRALSEGSSPVGSLNGSEMAEDDNLAIPPDWGPPKVSVPLLNLVDVTFELHGRGWIRRQVFWMAKQVLQLGMGDAIDDFLLGKISELRREETVAAGIKWLHNILWPDGIFLTKHPSRLTKNLGQEGSFEQRLESARRAGVVREIILDRAPAALVSLIGRRQYLRCATDLYFFLQSAVCLKQLAYSLLELLLVSAFPELQETIFEVQNM